METRKILEQAQMGEFSFTEASILFLALLDDSGAGRLGDDQLEESACKRTISAYREQFLNLDPFYRQKLLEEIRTMHEQERYNQDVNCTFTMHQDFMYLFVRASEAHNGAIPNSLNYERLCISNLPTMAKRYQARSDWKAPLIPKNIKNPLKDGEKLADHYRTVKFMLRVSEANDTTFAHTAIELLGQIYTRTPPWFVKRPELSRQPPRDRQILLQYIAEEVGKELRAGEVDDEVEEAFDWLLVKVKRIHNLLSDFQGYKDTRYADFDVDDARDNLSGKPPTLTGLSPSNSARRMCSCGLEILKPLDEMDIKEECEECIREAGLPVDDKSEHIISDDASSFGPSEHAAQEAVRSTAAPPPLPSSGDTSASQADKPARLEHTPGTVSTPYRRGSLLTTEDGPQVTTLVYADRRTMDSSDSQQPVIAAEPVVIDLTSPQSQNQGRAQDSASTTGNNWRSLPTLTAEAQSEAEFQKDLEPMRQLWDGLRTEIEGIVPRSSSLQKTALGHLHRLREEHLRKRAAGNRGGRQNAIFTAMYNRAMYYFSRIRSTGPVAEILHRTEPVVVAKFIIMTERIFKALPDSSDLRDSVNPSIANAQLPPDLPAPSRKRKREEHGTAASETTTTVQEVKWKRGGGNKALNHAVNPVPDMDQLTDEQLDARVFDRPDVPPRELVGDFLRLAKKRSAGQICKLYKPLALRKGWTILERTNLEHRLVDALSWKAGGDPTVYGQLADQLEADRKAMAAVRRTASASKAGKCRKAAAAGPQAMPTSSSQSRMPEYSIGSGGTSTTAPDQSSVHLDAPSRALSNRSFPQSSQSRPFQSSAWMNRSSNFPTSPLARTALAGRSAAAPQPAPGDQRHLHSSPRHPLPPASLSSASSTLPAQCLLPLPVPPVVRRVRADLHIPIDHTRTMQSFGRSPPPSPIEILNGEGNVQAYQLGGEVIITVASFYTLEQMMYHLSLVWDNATGLDLAGLNDRLIQALQAQGGRMSMHDVGTFRQNNVTGLLRGMVSSRAQEASQSGAQAVQPTAARKRKLSASLPKPGDTIIEID